MKFVQDVKSYVWGRRVQLATILAIASVVLALWGGWRMLAYSLPMQTGDYLSAAESGSGNAANAYYDAGLVAYQNEQYKEAKEYFTAAQSALTSSSGDLPPEAKAMAAKIQFALGNNYFRQKQLKAAAEAYRQSLRFEPNNLEAKYNLELMQQLIAAGGGNGPGQPKDPGGNGPGGPKKGI